MTLETNDPHEQGLVVLTRGWGINHLEPQGVSTPTPAHLRMPMLEAFGTRNIRNLATDFKTRRKLNKIKNTPFVKKCYKKNQTSTYNAYQLATKIAVSRSKSVRLLCQISLFHVRKSIYILKN